EPVFIFVQNSQIVECPCHFDIVLSKALSREGQRSTQDALRLPVTPLSSPDRCQMIQSLDAYAERVTIATVVINYRNRTREELRSRAIIPRVHLDLAKMVQHVGHIRMVSPAGASQKPKRTLAQVARTA